VVSDRVSDAVDAVVVQDVARQPDSRCRALKISIRSTVAAMNLAGTAAAAQSNDEDTTTQ
jgi:hypothetical protein